MSHQAVLRCIYGYFSQKSVNEIPYLEVPLGTVIRLNPNFYDNNEERYDLESRNKSMTLPDSS